MASPSAFKLSSKQCSACNVSFENDSVRRAHSKAPWHVENLRRRVAGLGPIDATAFSTSGTTLTPQTRDDFSDDGSDNDSLSLSDESGDASSSEKAPKQFTPEQCLFCNETFELFDHNILHMQKSHGLFIKDIDHLVVDLETLVRYLHLVVFQYHECLYCHSQRRTAEAAQQHMIGKGHCKIDIQTPDSEYRDFFDFNANESGNQLEHSAATLTRAPNPESESVHLPSGKIVTSRTAGPASQKQQQHRSSSPTSALAKARLTTSPDASGTNPEPASLEASSQALTRGERRDISLTDQLATLSVSDRQSLAHLPSPQQRSVLTTKKKQLDKARRAELRSRSRLELLTNKTSQKHFIEDVRAGKGIQL